MPPLSAERPTDDRSGQVDVERNRIADEREVDYEMRLTVADERERLADEREHRADQREIGQDRREAQESSRQRQADAHAAERDRKADERDRVADSRDRVADERDRTADQREIDEEIRGGGRVWAGRHATLAATLARLRQRLASAALDVARVEDELAHTLERRAQRDPTRAEELYVRAAAARRHAESERMAARRLSGE